MADNLLELGFLGYGSTYQCLAALFLHAHVLLWVVAQMAGSHWKLKGQGNGVPPSIKINLYFDMPHLAHILNAFLMTSRRVMGKLIAN